jgi:hypothetical protein
MLMEAAMVYPTATAARLTYWTTPQKVTLALPRMARTASM